MESYTYHNAVPDDDLRLITIGNAARFLSVSRGTIYYLLRTGQLASVHIGRSRRIPTDELQRFVRSRVALQARRNTAANRTRSRSARKVV